MVHGDGSTASSTDITFPDADYPRPLTAANGRTYYRSGDYPTDKVIRENNPASLLSYMGVPSEFIPRAVAAHDQPMVEEIDAWVESLEFIFRPHQEFAQEQPEMCGVGLILHGPSGTRKTTMAAALLLRLVRMQIPNTDPFGKNRSYHGAAMGRFVDWQEASELFRSAVSDREAEAEAAEIRRAMWPAGDPLHRADFLVIDDISRERTTEFNVGELQRILRRRRSHGYPTIITTNVAPEKWRAVYGDVFATYAQRSFIQVRFD